MRPGSLGIIYVKTHRDSEEDFQRVYKELQSCLLPDWFVITVDGDQWPDLSRCLNIGIDYCIAQGAEYISWLHGDFHYDDLNWFVTLRNTLIAYPHILKICASNSRDPILGWRIGQEQSWLIKSESFQLFPWLYFDERFIRCGGCEDYMQHLNILFRALLCVITPEATIFHKGAQTRGKYDTNPHQIFNQSLFGQISGFNQLVEVHDKKYFGCLWDDNELSTLIGMIAPELRKALGLENFSGLPERIRLPCEHRLGYQNQIAPFRHGHQNQIKAKEEIK
jgi:hypothetical protein